MHDEHTYPAAPIDARLLLHLIDRHRRHTLPRLRRLWMYFRNEPGGDGGMLVRDFPQMRGLPPRLQGQMDDSIDDRFQREIVIENDIAWRIQTLVDFMFPEPPRFISRAGDPAVRAAVERLLERVVEANGGAALWQDAALLGSVYGHVDLLLGGPALEGITAAANRDGEAASNPSPRSRLDRFANDVTIEAVEAPRAIPLLNRDDYRRLDAYILSTEREEPRIEEDDGPTALHRRMVHRLVRRMLARPQVHRRARTEHTRVMTAERTVAYVDGQLVDDRPQWLGRLPVVHIQNHAQPYRWEGLSDVEPLIPLQNELNTRLSDRANRVTMQSFRMYLVKGLEDFASRPVGPGQMWMSDNPEARVDIFGGDADTPSEHAHIEQLREALDRASGVTPAAAGHIRARIGNLTSENALRISLMGTLAKVKRKRVTYGRGMAELAAMILEVADRRGVLRTAPGDRAVEIAWPDPLPIDQSRRIADALSLAQLGVPLATLRARLGHADD